MSALISSLRCSWSRCPGSSGSYLASGLVASLILFEPAKPSGAQREVAAWAFGPAEAARVATPAFLLCGAHSRPWFRENVAILAELDHLAPLTRPDKLASTIGQFVGHPAPTPS